MPLEPLAAILSLADYASGKLRRKAIEMLREKIEEKNPASIKPKVNRPKQKTTTRRYDFTVVKKDLIIRVHRGRFKPSDRVLAKYLKQ